MYRGQYMLTDVRKLQLKYTISCYQKYVDKEVTTIKIIVHFSHTKAKPTKLKCSQDNTLPPVMICKKNLPDINVCFFFLM